MIVFIIAGGSGTRLWPLSTHDFPKHLLSLTNNKSLLQNTYDRVQELTSSDKIFVIPEASHAELVRQQLPLISRSNIIVEPARRGTASCFLLALAHVRKSGINDDESIFFLWADHLIRDTQGFLATMLKAGEIAETENRLTFIGVEPTYPSTGFGYMEKDDELPNWKGAYKLASFKEKPDQKTAQKYFRKGRFLWNTGYLVGTLATFERELKEHSKEFSDYYNKLLSTNNVNKTYLMLDSSPIDTVLSEKVQDGVIVPGSFDWADVGSFQDLHNISMLDKDGNYVRGDSIELEHTTNSYIRNDENKPVAVIGLDNIVVVNGPNGVLITNKNYAQKVGEVSKRIQSGGK
jgi:mannose-1-phosphate guanylyltransferase